MKALQNILVIFLVVLSISSSAFAGNKDKNTNSNLPAVTETAGNKALKGVMVLDKMPIMDKDICSVELNFDIIVEGKEVSLFNKSVGEFSNVEVLFGDGNNSQSFDDTHTYEKEGVHYLAVSIYDQNTGCMDFVGANVYIGAKENGSDKVIISSSDLDANSVANLSK